MDFIGSAVGGQAPPSVPAPVAEGLDPARRPRDHLLGATGAGCAAQVHLPPFVMIPVWGVLPEFYVRAFC
jgi:hypothetical protein